MQMEIIVQCFEEVQKKLDLNFVTSIKVLKEVTVPRFEEVEKKPAGFFYACVAQLVERLPCKQ